MRIYDELKMLFEPRSVAVVGASREPNKVGHVILKNLVDYFHGDVYPVNPKAGEILGKKCYASVRDIPGPIDVAVISVHAESVPEVMRDCARKRVRGAIIISGGFSEVGRKDLELETLKIARRAGIRILGPNCLGIFDAHTRMDTLFLPSYRLERPRQGTISFVSQSGAVGSAVLDWAASEGFGVSKFISYGNAIDLDESDFFEYLAYDRRTKVICAYIEGVRDGRRMMESAKKTGKPIIVIKGGKTDAGSRAATSHTGVLAGADAVYDAAFRQCNMIRVSGTTEMFDIARVLAEQPPAFGNRIQILTNGGGFGVLGADAVAENGMRLAQMSQESRDFLKSRVPNYAVVGNPLDLVGDADAARYRSALDAIADDRNVDAVLCAVLFQTAGIESEVVDVITAFSDARKKPIVVCSAGGSYAKLHMRMLEKNGVPTYDSPARAAAALSGLVRYGHMLRKREAP